MKRIYYLLSIVIFTSCSPSNNSASAQTDSIDQASKDESLEKPQVNFQVLDDADINVEKLSYQGEIVAKRAWQDVNGNNVVLFSKTEEELFVYHYFQNAKDIELSRKVYDFEKDCEFDLIIEFILESISVTDIDNNNRGEITFGYKKTCTSDVSPLTLKLLMLENGDKYIMRGTTLVDFGPDNTFGGDKNIDPSFENAPKGFLSHANKVWDTIVK